MRPVSRRRANRIRELEEEPGGNAPFGVVGRADGTVTDDNRRQPSGRGGNAALYFGTHWPGLFAGVVPASGYYTVEDEFLANLRGVAVLAAWGTDPGHRDANAYQKALVARLQKAGADVTPREQDGRATDRPGKMPLP